MITEELVRGAFTKLKTPAAFDYFFDKISSAEWIKPILSVNPKILQVPPGPEVTESGTAFPDSSVSKYLARVADQEPDLVLEIIKNTKGTKNCRVHEDFVDAALNMPSPQAIEISHRAVAWLEQDYFFFLPEKCAKLSVRLANEGFPNPALQLFRAIIKPIAFEQPKAEGDESRSRARKAKARFRDWTYEKILENQFIDLVEALGRPAIRVGLDALQEALRIEDSQDESFWRPAIEEHGQNKSDDIKDHLLDAVREGFITYLRSKPEELTEVVSELVSSKANILKRLGHYLAGNEDFGSTRLVERILLERRTLEELPTWHEVATLLRTWFWKLSPEATSTLISWISEGPIEADEEKAELRKKLWQHRILTLLSARIPTVLNGLHESLEREFGPMEHPDFHSYMSSGWVGPTSPLSASEMSEMTVQQLLEYLRTWKHSKEWFAPTPEGLARQLEGVVKVRPTEFLADPSELQSLNPTYCRVIVEALGGTELPFDWDKAMTFFEWIVKQGVAETTGRYNDEDPGFAWARVSIVRLLQKLFNGKEQSLPFSTRARVWEILKAVTNDPHPTAHSEEQYLGNRTNYYQHCINTSRGTAIEAVLLYSLWVRRNLEVTGEAPSLDLVPEVKDLLEQHLDLQIDAQISIRAVYGRWLPWLTLMSEDWVKTLLPKILPESTELRRHHESAWFTYLQFCDVYNSVFGLLKDYYTLAVGALAELNTDFKPSSSNEPESKLSEHLVVAYARGLPGSDELIDRFFSTAPSALRAHAIEFCGRALKVKPGEEASTSLVQRLRALWEKRAAQDTALIREELRQFGWWVLSHAFDPSWALDQLTVATERAGAIDPDSLIFRDLITHADREPKRVLRFSEVFVDGPLKNNSVWFHEDSFHELLKELKEKLAGDDRHRLKALLNRLGAAGYLRFRDLLPNL